MTLFKPVAVLLGLCLIGLSLGSPIFGACSTEYEWVLVETWYDATFFGLEPGKYLFFKHSRFPGTKDVVSYEVTSEVTHIIDVFLLTQAQFDLWNDTYSATMEVSELDTHQATLEFEYYIRDEYVWVFSNVESWVSSVTIKITAHLYQKREVQTSGFFLTDLIPSTEELILVVLIGIGVIAFLAYSKRN